MTKNRIVADLVLLIGLFVLPWWVFATFVFLLVLTFPIFIEGPLFFSAQLFLLGASSSFWFWLALIVMGLVILSREFFLESYLRKFKQIS